MLLTQNTTVTNKPMAIQVVLIFKRFIILWVTPNHCFVFVCIYVLPCLGLSKQQIFPFPRDPEKMVPSLGDSSADVRETRMKFWTLGMWNMIMSKLAKKINAESALLQTIINKVREKGSQEITSFRFQTSYRLLSILPWTIKPAYRTSLLPVFFYPNSGRVSAKKIWNWNHPFLKPVDE